MISSRLQLTLRQLLSFVSGDLDTSKFTGPVLALNGNNDYIMCDGYCPGVFEEPAKTYYRNAKPFVQHLQPNSGHQFMFQHNATGAFAVITNFLNEYV